MENVSNKYVIYCRRSTDEPNKQQDSIPAQIKACVEYRERCWDFDIADRMLKEPPVFLIDEELEKEYWWNDVYKPYIDKVRDKFVVIERRSAKTSGNRKKRTELVKLVKKWKVKWILSYSPDRASRNMLEAWELIDLVDNKYLNLKFTNFAFENSPSGKMMLAVLFWFAKHYSDNRAEMTTRGQNNKGLRGEALWPKKYGYIINDANSFEPHPQYREIMQMAFTMRLYNKDATDDSIAERLNQQWFKTVKRVWKSNPLYGKQKYIEEAVNYKNLWDIRIDPFYYGVLTYWEERYDQRELNEYYWEPMITEEEHARLIDRSTKHYLSTQNKALKEQSKDYLPFPEWMVQTLEWKNLSGWVPSINKRFGKHLFEAKKTNPDATFADVLAPHQIKYRYAHKKNLYPNVNISAKELMDAMRVLLWKLAYLEEHHNVYVEYVEKENIESQRELSNKRQAFRLQKWRKEREMNEYMDSVMRILSELTPKEKERYYKKLAEYEKSIKEIDVHIVNLENDRRQDMVTSLVMYEYFKNAVDYYNRANYVQAAKIAQIFVLNIVVTPERQVTIKVKPMLEWLFSGMVTDTGLEPVTSAMSMQRSRQLS